MSSNTKIVVLRSKEIIYALVLLVVSVLIIMVAVSLFMPAKDAASPVPAQNAEETPEQMLPQTPSQTTPDTSPSATAPDGANQTSSTVTDTNTTARNIYVPGIYSSTLLLGTAHVELQVAVDKDHINSITLTNLDESVTTLYPLMSPTLSELSAVILAEQSIENVSYGEENRYTSMLLMQAITAALDKAAVSENADRPETGTLY